MTLIIKNGVTGTATVHKATDLAREARHAVKGRGKFIGYHVSIQDGAPSGATVSLVADYQQPDGWRSQVNVAI